MGGGLLSTVLFLGLMEKILYVMLGGSLGALSRWGLGLLAARVIPGRFPWGTFTANMIGCFLIGVAFALSDRTNYLSPSFRLFFMTGFLGALTTFSTYCLETVSAFRSGVTSPAVLNFFLNNLFGLLLVLAGMWAVGWLFQGR